MKVCAALFFAAVSIFFLGAQQQVLGVPERAGSAASRAENPTPPQTARQALIEMITGGEKGITRHLTVEVQELLSKNKQSAMIMAALSGMQGQRGNVQTFPAGSALAIINEPAQHTRLEIDVDNDDLSGDQDVLQLSLHSFHDGNEQKQQADDFGFMSSRITVTMQKQQNIWRLNNVGVGVELPVGDPEFLKKTFLNASDTAGVTGMGVAVAPGKTESPVEHPAEPDPQGALILLAAVEGYYASQHPETGFTCSLPELIETGKSFNLEPQLATNNTTYKLSVMGCEGRPAGSFQIVAEPMVKSAGVKAFCTDATRNIRISDDGLGSSCLTSGHFFRSGEIQGQEEDGGLDLHVHHEPSKP